MQRQVLGAGIAARKQDLLGDHQPPGREQDQRAQFGHAVDRQPADEVEREVAIVVDRQHRPERQPLIDRQHHRRHAGRHAQAERHDADHGVVAEQHVCKEPERFHEPRPRREDLVVQEVGAGAGGTASAREPRWHEGGVPGFVLHSEHEACHGPDHEAEGRDQDMPAGRAHGRRQIASEERAQALERIGARPIDRQERPQRETLEIEQQVAVERDGARHRQRRQRSAIEDRQPLQLVERQGPHPTPLDPVDQALELLSLIHISAALPPFPWALRPPFPPAACAG